VLKRLVPLIVIAAVAIPLVAGLMSPGLDADVAAAQQSVATVEGPQLAAGAEGSSAVSALMAGNVVGRRGSAFGRRLPVSVFIP
jgi:hypothetical protein